jgi:hypothetical protein
MTVRPSPGSPPRAPAVSDAQLHELWEAQFATIAGAGVPDEQLAEAMLAVATARLAAAMGPDRLSRVLQMVSLAVYGDAQRVNAAVAEAIGRRRAAH